MIPVDIHASFKAALFSGQYSLLLGAGASLDGRKKGGDPIIGGAGLTKLLADKKGAPSNTTLQRVSGLYSPDELHKILFDEYTNLVPGRTVQLLPDLIWRRIYTFNIDDLVGDCG